MAARNNTVSSLAAMTASMRLKAEDTNCQLCCTSDPIKEFKIPGRCGHSFCTDCARHYYTLKIQRGEYSKFSCPICSKPELGNNSSGNEMFLKELYAYLSKFLPKDVMAKFVHVQEMHKKMDDPNFVRCPNINCSHGFIKRANIKQEECPECKRWFCNECLQLWHQEHSNMTCTAYAKWMTDSCTVITNQISIKIDEKTENLSKCPKCKFTFILIRGDCLHSKCEICGAEFCNFCNALFTRDVTCCKKNLGLHAHHPRNCYYYLRDVDISELQNLLQIHGVAFHPDDVYMNPKEKRYLEYLCELIKTKRIDPVTIMTLHNIKQELLRHNLPNPEHNRGPYEGEDAFLKKCQAILQEKVPLFRK